MVWDPHLYIKNILSLGHVQKFAFHAVQKMQISQTTHSICILHVLISFLSLSVFIYQSLFLPKQTSKLHATKYSSYSIYNHFKSSFFIDTADFWINLPIDVAKIDCFSSFNLMIARICSHNFHSSVFSSNVPYFSFELLHFFAFVPYL